jgi:Ca2+-transporting ATPase
LRTVQIIVSSTDTIEAPYSKTAQGLAEQLGSDLETGLDSAEVAARLETFGPNRLEVASSISPWKIFLRQFQDLMVLILIGAVLIAFLTWWLEGAKGFPADAVIILAIVVANAALGFLQEYGAERAIEELQKSATTKARVRREGQVVGLPQEELVPGDVILLSEGDKVPADSILVTASHLRVNESMLTGESVPVDKEVGPVEASATIDARTCALYAGSTITAGEATALVVATGQRTELGSIATSLGTTRSEATPLEAKLGKLGAQIGWGILVLSVVITVTVLLVERKADLATLTRVAMFSVALAVAAVPEGLPAVLTVSLSAGARRLAQRHAVARRMSAVETLGSVTVIVTDKTGTLTHNQMTVQKLMAGGEVFSVSGEGLSTQGQIDGGNTAAQALIECGALANGASLEVAGETVKAVGDPMDAGLLVLAEKGGVDWRALHSSHSKLDDIPFSSERARMSHLRRTPKGNTLYCKGAAQAVLRLCSTILGPDGTSRPLEEADLERVREQEEEFAQAALRTLAFARRAHPEESSHDSSEQGLEFLGLAAFIDPPRGEVPEAIKTCREAGIRVIMLTGDHPTTASAIAHSVGLTDEAQSALTGADLAKMDAAERDRQVKTHNVWARVAPDQKLALVSSLIAQNEVVAMTGDGVNDAPALKKVHVGVAMGQSGTAVAVEASDIVLTDDNFATIVAAVEEGRAVFANVRRFIAFLFSGNFGVVAAMFLGTVFAGVYGLRYEGYILLPLAAAQILWMNLVTDGAPAVAFALGRGTPYLMKEPPRHPNDSILTRDMWWLIALTGTALCGMFLVILDVLYPGGIWTIEPETAVQARSAAFYTLVTARLINSLNFLDLRGSVFSPTTWTNRYVPVAALFSWLLTVLMIFWPVSAGLFGLTAPAPTLLAGLTLVAIPVVLLPAELYKWHRRRSEA